MRMASLVVHFAFSHNKLEPLLTPSPPHSLRQEEIAALSGPDEFAEFYRRLKQVRTLDLLWFSFLLLPSPLLPSPSLLLPLSLPLPPPSQLKEVSLRRGKADANRVSEAGQREGNPGSPSMLRLLHQPETVGGESTRVL